MIFLSRSQVFFKVSGAVGNDMDFANQWLACDYEMVRPYLNGHIISPDKHHYINGTIKFINDTLPLFFSFEYVIM